MDFIIPTERFPSAGETIPGGDLETAPGGKGANQACAAGRLGGDTVLVAQIGNDPLAARLLESLEQSNVNTEGVGVANRSSGCAMICVRSDGENAIVISPGANATLTPALALERLDRVQAGDIILLQLEIPMETVAVVATHGRRRNATVVLDPAPARALAPSLLNCVSILTPNQSESADLLRAAANTLASGGEYSAIAAALLAQGPESVILKLGSDGCFCAHRDSQFHSPGFPVNAVDTTAAGDVFNGALAVALSKNKTLAEAALFANAASAISVTRKGAQPSIPSRRETVEFLQSRGAGLLGG